jgi:RNA polymerase sigma-70 factor (ECF subfamily)
MELRTLLERCRQGDDLAWEMLVRRFQGRVYGVGMFYLSDAEEARDLAQEVFVRVYRRLDLCTNDETFVPWMIQIARNAAIDRLRRQKARPSAVGIPVEEMTYLRSNDPDPAEQFHRNERQALVHRGMERLSQINREIIFLKDIQGLSLESIASLLKVPLGTIKSRSSRARIELARIIIALTKARGARPDLEVGP